MWKEAVAARFCVITLHLLGGTVTKRLSEDLNAGFPDFEAEALSIRPRGLFLKLCHCVTKNHGMKSYRVVEACGVAQCVINLGVRLRRGITVKLSPLQPPGI
jgi:hypothetical protein